MRILPDTNVLLRSSDPTHVHHRAAVAILRQLALAGNTFTISSQTIYEFLAVATRSVTDRGLGMNQEIADAEISKLISSLDVAYDSAAVVGQLRNLVVKYSVIGKSIHDARLVAVMLTEKITDLLTFNTRDFSRYSEIKLIDPSAAIPPAP